MPISGDTIRVNTKQKSKKSKAVYKVEPQEVIVYLPIGNGYMYAQKTIQYVKVLDYEA